MFQIQVRPAGLYLAKPRLNRHVLNSSMLHPSHTPTSAAIGGFSVPNDENQNKNTMQPTQRNIRIIQPVKLLGFVARNENKAETITKANPVKNDQRTPIDRTTKPTTNKIWLATNLISVFFTARQKCLILCSVFTFSKLSKFRKVRIWIC